MTPLVPSARRPRGRRRRRATSYLLLSLVLTILAAWTAFLGWAGFRLALAAGRLLST